MATNICAIALVSDRLWQARGSAGVLLCQLHIPQSLIPIVQVGVGACQECVDGGIVGRKLLRDCSSSIASWYCRWAYKRISQPRVERSVVGSELQRCAVFSRRLWPAEPLFRKLSPGSCAGSLNRPSQFRQLRLSQGCLRPDADRGRHRPGQGAPRRPSVPASGQTRSPQPPALAGADR